MYHNCQNRIEMLFNFWKQILSTKDKKIQGFLSHFLVTQQHKILTSNDIKGTTSGEVLQK